ncbi:MAG: SWIM zinc finger family protein [Actinomycetales bacterium]
MSEQSAQHPGDQARWPSDRVLDLAPDAASVSAGRKIADSPGWSGEGCTPHALWGLASGSGKNPYRTVVDLDGPAYSCSCPSRKFPCKHSLGLLLRWSNGRVPAGEPPEFAATWLAGRAERAQAKATKAAEAKPADPAAQAKRARAREAKVASGMDELRRWLADQARLGLTQLRAGGYAACEAPAARMVDAQAPGVASWLRELASVMAAGGDWPDRLLEELGLLQLLADAHSRLPELDEVNPRLAATVRAHIGYPVAKEAVQQQPAMADHWLVWGIRTTLLDRLTQRTAYLTGLHSGRTAYILSFSVGAAAGDPLPVPGRWIDADLHPYPSGGRVLLGEVRGEVESGWDGVGTDAQHTEPRLTLGVEAALGRVAAVLADDPWAREIPVPLLVTPTRHENRWLLVDGDGASLPLGGVEPWRLVATCAGQLHPMLACWTPRGWIPVAVRTPDRRVIAA